MILHRRAPSPRRGVGSRRPSRPLRLIRPTTDTTTGASDALNRNVAHEYEHSLPSEARPSRIRKYECRTRLRLVPARFPRCGSEKGMIKTLGSKPACIAPTSDYLHGSILNCVFGVGGARVFLHVIHHDVPRSLSCSNDPRKQESAGLGVLQTKAGRAS